ncbi:PE domain-containing protein [Mycolicibacterium frederiksbergense]|uniref:PE domain-containing protein n=1 Tax=Mycolicibacterium frederiksbergense TaxID=117567 RepID=A0A6H0RZP4_9MYCO|nr:PE domain-containing protein [Mycolicibacterium frederiksbergense]QIV79931.1 PE domain-containing protein [Mycolicibacterium frederiksbergense]
MDPFIMIEPAAVTGSSGAAAGLAGEAAAHGGQAAASAAVVPPGLEEISAANAAKIMTLATEASAVIQAGAAFHAEHGVAMGASAVITDLADAMNYTAIGGIL